jgi:hypothetical protein
MQPTSSKSNDTSRRFVYRLMLNWIFAWRVAKITLDKSQTPVKGERLGIEIGAREKWWRARIGNRTKME